MEPVLTVGGVLAAAPLPVERHLLDPYCQGHGCSDGLRDGTEVDVDCGGDCSKCAAGQRCNGPSDCDSAVCVGGTCQAASCTDGVINQGEANVDCGGPNCPGCADGQTCATDSDCAGGACLPTRLVEQVPNHAPTIAFGLA
jgi:hypothetical protein